MDDQGQGRLRPGGLAATPDSEAQVKRTSQQSPFAPVVRDGKVVPEVAQVIAIAARNNLCRKPDTRREAKTW
jgi:hypothetical protein